MYSFLLKFHSGFRYLVLLLLVLTIVQALAGWFGKKSYTETNRKLNLFGLIFAHIQLLVGLILYFYSPFVKLAEMAATMKDASLRYWTVEHLVMMIFAVVLITVGHSKSKKAADAVQKHRTVAIFYGLALLVILVAIVQSGRPILGSAS
jgi:cytochrome bd-type quinol oxidase subunit 2